MRERSSSIIDGGASPDLSRIGIVRRGASAFSAIGSKIALGIRPHALRVGERRHSREGRFPASGSATRRMSRLMSAAAPSSRSRMTHIAERPGSDIALSVAAEDLHLFDAGTGQAIAHGELARMSDPLIVGIDAGTSVIKSVAFTSTASRLRSPRCPTPMTPFPAAVPSRTWRGPGADTAETLAAARREDTRARRTRARDVGHRAGRRHVADRQGGRTRGASVALARCARGVDRRGICALARPCATLQANRHRPERLPDEPQLAWMTRHRPEILARATTAFHCKDWLYFKLTGERATDPSEANFTFGEFRTRNYAPHILDELGAGELQAPPAARSSTAPSMRRASARKRPRLPG